MITIQVKDPYVSVYRSGLRLTYGKTLNVSPEDPRVLFWLENGFAEEERIFMQKCREINEIDRFVNKHSFSAYYELVRTYFSDVPKMFWWQDVVSLDKFGEAGL